MENSKEYIKDAIRTESRDFDAMDKRLMDDGTKRLMHAAFGLSTEAGEFLDAMKKHIFYGKDIFNGLDRGITQDSRIVVINKTNCK